MSWWPTLVGDVWRVIARALLVALLVAVLAEGVLFASVFSHDKQYLALLASHPGLFWGLAVAAGLLLWVRHCLDPEGTRALWGDAKRFALVVALLAVAALVPYLTAYATHFTHPLLAVWLAWLLWPVFPALFHKVGELWQRRIVHLWGHPAAFWVAALGAFAVVFVQSYRRFYWFGAGGKDLGLFHQSVWLFSQLQTPHNTVMGMHTFADHLEFIDLAIAPLMWLWPSAGALLLFQAALVGLGIVPVMRFAQQRLGSVAAMWALGLTYLLGMDLQHAVMFDFNPTTCGAALLPWVVWAFERERPVAFGLALAAVALTKENLVLYALCLCLTLAIGPKRRLPLAAAALLAVWFVVEMKLIFPLFAQSGFRHMRFDALGNTWSELVTTVLTQPVRALALLLTPGNKINGLLLPFSSVAFACFLAPRWVVAFLPVILERFWSSHANRWWGFHYGAGIGVLAVLATIDGLGNLKAWRPQRRDWLGVAVVAVLASTVLVGTLGRFGMGPLWLYRHSYYTTPTDRADAVAVMQVIPAGASVAAQNHLLPYLSGRREIWEIRRPIHADYVALDLWQDAWPFEKEYSRTLALELLRQGYGVVACQGQALVLQRGAASVPCAALGPPP